MRKNWALLGLATAALAVVVARAAIQSIVIDEADGYTVFAANSWRTAFFPGSGNHVLNTVLVILATQAFGLNQFTVRIPAILGAAIYIAAAAYLVLRISERKWVQLPLFVCLAYNPMVLDYLVASRGYSLAIACLLAAVAFLSAGWLQAREPSLREAACASLFLGLSFCANFAFAFVDALVMLVFLGFAWRDGQLRRGLAAQSLLPGALAALAICGGPLLNWPKGQLYFGAESFSEMWKSLVEPTFDALNPRLTGAWLSSYTQGDSHVRFWMAWISVAAVVLLFLFLLLRRTIQGASFQFGVFLLIVLATTLLAHWAAFQATHLLLPKGRTGLFLVLLFTLFLGYLVAQAWQASRTRWAGYFGTAILTLNALYFLGCSRLTYFHEWRYNSDSRQIYELMKSLRQRCALTDWITEWRYMSALNFYRDSLRDGQFPEFEGSTTIPAGHSAYLVYDPDSKEFIQAQGLRRVYYNPETQAAIAVRGCTAEPGSSGAR